MSHARGVRIERDATEHDVCAVMNVARIRIVTTNPSTRGCSKPAASRKRIRPDVVFTDKGGIKAGKHHEFHIT